LQFLPNEQSNYYNSLFLAFLAIRANSNCKSQGLVKMDLTGFAANHFELQ
jgi:hypothetical protein